MAIALNINGTTYQYPEVGDQKWGSSATDWATAVTNGCLQKSGGAFTLLAEVDFGGSYGAKALYLKSRTSNPSSTGIVRLANGDSISFRNFANSADIALSTNASDQLTYNGVVIQSVVTVSDTATINMTLTGSDISGIVIADSLTNTHINSSAAIDATKLADGTVTNTELQYINSLSSNAQDQLNLKSPLISPSFTTPSLGVATATSINGTTIPNTKTLVVTTDKISVLAATTSVELAGVISDETGSGALVFANTPTLVTPALGAATATSINGSTIPTSKTLVVTTDKLSALAATSSAELAGVISDETGSGALVFGTSPTITSASIVTPTRLDMKKDTLANLQTYASTAADGQFVFATDTLATYVVKSSTLSTVGGGGLPNYILAPDAEAGIGAWVTYADAAGTSPVNGTGGSPNITYAVSVNTSLRGTSNFLFTKDAANRQGQGFSYDFTIDDADKGKVLQISLEYLISSGTYADNDMSFWIYDVTNAVLIQPAPYLLKNSTIVERLGMEFQTAINSTSYRLIGHVGSTSALAYTIRFDTFNISNQAKLYGSADTDFVDVSSLVSFTNITTTSLTAFARRNGTNIEIYGYGVVSGYSATAARFNLPWGAVTKTSAALTIVDGTYINSAVTTSSIVPMINSSRTYVTFGWLANGGSAQLVELGGSTFNSPGNISFNFSIPIEGWSSSQVMSSDADTRVVAAIVTGDPASATVGNPIIVPTISYDSHAGYNATTGRYTVPVPGIYKLYGALQSASAATTLTIYKNAVSNILAGSLDSNGEGTYIGSVNCVAGDILDIRPGGTVDATSFTLNIERISGPSQIMASESVSASYWLSANFTSSTTIPINFDSKEFDSHNAVTTSPTAWKFTAPMSGCYSIGATTVPGTNAYYNVYKNGTLYKALGYSLTSGMLSSTILIKLLAGEYVDLRTHVSSTQNGGLLGQSGVGNINITRIGN